MIASIAGLKNDEHWPDANVAVCIMLAGVQLSDEKRVKLNEDGEIHTIV